MQISRASLTLAVLLGLAATYAEASCVCGRIYDPVCGNDGMTYGNPCTLRCARDTGSSSKGLDLAVAHRGACFETQPADLLPRALEEDAPIRLPALCRCPPNFQPVCDTDGVTHPNMCLFNCAKARKAGDLAVAHYGPCREEGPQVRSLPIRINCGVCPKLWRPVCGTDAKTYSNPCLLDCAKIEGSSSKGGELAVAHMGACDSVKDVSAPVLPVRPPMSRCICPLLLKPACGTDGKTYDNPCMVNCARIEGTSSKGAELAVAHMGACDSVNEVSAPAPPAMSKCGICPLLYKPACGTDGKTYSNPCMLNCARIEGTSSKGAELALAHLGFCEEPLPAEVQARELDAPASPRPCICIQLYSPVCGTDGRTYSNKCYLNCAKVQGTSSKGAELALAYEGSCTELNPFVYDVKSTRPTCACTRILLPVCGTDGITYSNSCLLNCASKAKGGAIQMAHEGEC